MTALRIGLIGYQGRMIKALIDCLGQAPARPTLAALLAREDSPLVGTLAHGVIIGSVATHNFAAADVWIEFAHPQGTAATIQKAAAAGKALVIATTGLSPETLAIAESAAAHIPIVIAANTSLGVAVLNAAVALVAARLKDYDCEIVELHHRMKKDAPSGTALMLARTAAKAREQPEEKFITGRHGIGPVRQANDLGVLAVRGGGIIGEHTVYFIGDSERLELTHRAQSRALFAEGALYAAKQIVHKAPGLYTMASLLS